MTSIERYQHILATKGISLQRLGLSDTALRKDDALDAIRVLSGLSVPILGGDVYLERRGSIEPGYANWHADRHDGETEKEFALRSCLKAEDYVGKFPERSGEHPLFVLVTSSE